MGIDDDETNSCGFVRGMVAMIFLVLGSCDVKEDERVLFTFVVLGFILGKKVKKRKNWR